MHHAPITNTAAYTFITLSQAQLVQLRPLLKEKATELQLKGTLLLSTEGINLFVAGHAEHIQSFKDYITTQTPFGLLFYKDSHSKEQPFTRMLVRIKKELIAMGIDSIKPEKTAAPYIQPETLKSWYDNNKDMLVLDTRNDYEIQLGQFAQAHHLNIDTFRHFPDAAALMDDSLKDIPVVTYCTGGIRCEKAAQLMLNYGFKEVYQLEGGILNYFDKCGSNHYQGECFVFDKRVAVDAQLQETGTRQCYGCRMPLTTAEQATMTEKICPHCGQSIDGKRDASSARDNLET